MYRSLRVAVVIPAYNEEKLIAKTVLSVPDYVDRIIAVNDKSTDNTGRKLDDMKKTIKNLEVINSEKNGGVGHSIKAGLKSGAKQDMDLFAVMAGDAQMDPVYLPKLLDEIIDKKLDFVKANRFMHLDELKKMPTYRKFGNIVITIITKFATGYYSIFDTQNGYVVYSRKVVEELSFDLLSNRYDYENTVLVGLSIIGAKIGDVPIPALYGDETSTINLLPTALKTLGSLHKGFWRRIYYKYILYNFHPIALFLLSGLMFMIFGFGFGIFALYEKLIRDISPTTGTVMLSVLPIILGFQMLLTALIMDVNNEGK